MNVFFSKYSKEKIENFDALKKIIQTLCVGLKQYKLLTVS